MSVGLGHSTDCKRGVLWPHTSKQPPKCTIMSSILATGAWFFRCNKHQAVCRKYAATSQFLRCNCAAWVKTGRLWQWVGQVWWWPWCSKNDRNFSKYRNMCTRFQTLTWFSWSDMLKKMMTVAHISYFAILGNSGLIRKWQLFFHMVWKKFRESSPLWYSADKV